MKIALYIEDGLEQIVLTPESDTEKSILGKMHDGSREMTMKRGSFYACRGGWMRHEQSYPDMYSSASSAHDDESTIVVLRPMKLRSRDEVLASEGAEEFIAKGGD